MHYKKYSNVGFNCLFKQSATAFHSSAPSDAIMVSSERSSRHGGTRVVRFEPTPELVTTGLVLVSISAMPAYATRSPEELRREDYQSGENGTHSAAN